MANEQHLDLLILGTGPAASRMVNAVREAGWEVGIADPKPFGGTCALRGCRPKKALTRAAALADRARRMRPVYLETGDIRLDWERLMAFKRRFTDPVTPHAEAHYAEAGIHTYPHAGRFVNPDTVQLGDTTVRAEHVVVATGARPIPLPIRGADLLTTSDELLERETLPERILLVGGGYIGFEFAHIVARAGAKATVLEMRPRPLAAFDPALTDMLVKRTREAGIEVHTETRVEGIEQKSSGALQVQAVSGQKPVQFEADLVVHGAGRVPNMAGLELGAGNVAHGKRGITVDAHLRSTTNPRVYAAGDVADTDAPPLSPAASHDGWVVRKNLLEDGTHAPDYRGIPSAVFTTPPMASVGLQETDAEQSGYAFAVSHGDMGSWQSTQKAGEDTAGFKLLLEKDTGKILGAHLLGPGAAETINLFAVAVKFGLTAVDLKSMLFAYPTFGADIRHML